MKKRIVWIGLAALAAVLAGAAASGKLALPWGGKKDETKTEVALEFAPREVVQPQLQPLAALVQFSGPLVAPNTAVLRSKAAGTLLELRVAEGSRVKAGQVLGAVDMAEGISRVAERQALAQSAQAQLQQAERSHASNQRLADQQFISPIALENSRAAVDTARAQYNAARAALKTAQLGQRDGALVAPIAGIVAKRHALPGEKLSMEQPVLTLVDLQRLELAGNVGTHEVSRLASGMQVQVNVEGQAQPVAGRIGRIAPAAEAGTRSIGVTIELPNPGEKLRAGQYALAQVSLADPTPRLTVPLAAVGSTAGNSHVWLIDQGALVRRQVLLGRRDEANARVEVLEGLQPGAQVLATRFDNLREGGKAVVVAARPAPMASGFQPGRAALKPRHKAAPHVDDARRDQEPGLRHHGDGGACACWACSPTTAWAWSRCPTSAPPMVVYMQVAIPRSVTPRGGNAS